MSRRAEYGETRMTLRADGLWHAYVSLGNDPITGERVRPHLTSKTKAGLRDRITQVKRDHEMGKLENGGSIPTEHWLRYWLGIIAANQRASTYARKEWAVVNW
ncbi:hypothetical protein FOJ82_00010 [Tessaracoccus rhinocerotis]|uniref:Integrase n=1 Tax=Tessaracoccus rhinocerotis TaxID=1689449 RepID=A0A553K3U0_9ACTN|nr:hypothetical protein [Tessaracoccus rhinocerotis]TRY19346.1 hypothetical protein FOJ82_00010 [Tessaracoccus rhinocerotis]